MYSARRKQPFYKTPAGIAAMVGAAVVLFLLVKYTGTDHSNASLTLKPTQHECQPGCPCNEGPIRVLSWEPRVLLYKGFVSAEEADYIIRKGTPHLERSRVVGQDQDVLSEVRTSSGVFMAPDGDPVLMAVEERIAKWSMIPKEFGESFYLLQYENGQQYQPHHDYFEGEVGQRYIGNSGQRTVTVLTYLSTPEEEGETVFPMAGLTVRPEKGDAVLFHNHKPNGELDPMSLHGGNPVIRGIKHCMTKWLRVKEYEFSWYVAQRQQQQNQ